MPTTFDVTDFGAIPDGETLATKAIQEALDAAGKQGGGTVVVPPGTFPTGTLHLRSFVTLELATGARLLGSPRMEDYPEASWNRERDRHRHHLLVADEVEGVTIRGGGTIDGNGPAFWKPQKAERTWIGAKHPRVCPMLEFRRCRDLRILDVTITNSPGWTVHTWVCDRVWLRGVKLLNHMFGPNTDGFDIDACRDVFISDCHVECGDDAIVLKTTPDAGRSLERVTVTNCVLRTHCVGLKTGANESYFPMRQITFSNCVVYGCTRAVGFYSWRGSMQEDIAVSNIVCDTDCGFILNRPIHIDVRSEDGAAPSGLRNVRISNLVARTDGRVLMTAADGGTVENVLLRDVQLIYPALDDPAATGAEARSAQFSNHSPEARVARAAVVADGLRNLVVEDLEVQWPDPDRAADWWDGPKQENSSTRAYPRADDAAGDPPMHAFWGRNLEGGRLHAPGAAANRPDVEAVHLEGSTLEIEG